MEHSRGVPQTWVMQGWWLLAFILASVRLQSVVVLIENVQPFPFEIYLHSLIGLLATEGRMAMGRGALLCTVCNNNARVCTGPLVQRDTRSSYLRAAQRKKACQQSR